MMSDPNPLPAGDAVRSRSELIAALPAVRKLTKQLHDVIEPAMVTECSAPEAVAIDQAVTAVMWMADAVDASNRTERVERLTEVTNRASYVTSAAHERLAELQSMNELAADEQHRREITYGTVAVVDGARLDVGLPNGTTATITLTVAPDGRVTWQAPTVELAPIDATDHLALTTALTQLGETLTRALPETAFEEHQ